MERFGECLFRLPQRLLRPLALDKGFCQPYVPVAQFGNHTGKVRVELHHVVDRLPAPARDTVQGRQVLIFVEAVRLRLPGESLSVRHFVFKKELPQKKVGYVFPRHGDLSSDIPHVVPALVNLAVLFLQTLLGQINITFDAVCQGLGMQPVEFSAEILIPGGGENIPLEI